MSTSAHTHRRGTALRLRRLAPWLGGTLLVAGIVMGIITLAPSKSAPPPGPAATPTKPAPTPKTVKLSAAATSVAREFVQTAVARQDLAAAWKISGPNIRAGLTYAEWKTGNIPVVPYPIGSLRLAPFKIDYSYANEAALEIALLPKASAKVKPQLFDLLLKRLRGTDGKLHWVVDNWAPHSSPIVPLGPG
jgi:hypothetical protein